MNWLKGHIEDFKYFMSDDRNKKYRIIWLVAIIVIAIAIAATVVIAQVNGVSTVGLGR